MTDKDDYLPAGVHAETLRARDTATGGELAETIVWADRSYDRCPRCGQQVPSEVGCPVKFNAGAGQGGALEERSQQHGCGEWLGVLWVQVTGSGETGEVAERDVTAAAERMAQARVALIAERRERIRARLRRHLIGALAELAKPLDGDETAGERAERLRSGDEMNPGVYHDGAQWVAWDFDPDGSGDVIDVTEGELTRDPI